KNKSYTFINISGLAVGITSCVLIFFFIYNQLNYDNWFSDAKHTYRVEYYYNDGNNLQVYPSVDGAAGPGLKNAFPEIEGFTRLVPFSGHFMRYGDNQFKENSVALADSGFFEIFPIPFIAGDGASALSQPNSIVITRE